MIQNSLSGIIVAQPMFLLIWFNLCSMDVSSVQNQPAVPDLQRQFSADQKSLRQSSQNISQGWEDTFRDSQKDGISSVGNSALKASKALSGSQECLGVPNLMSPSLNQFPSPSNQTVDQDCTEIAIDVPQVKDLGPEDKKFLAMLVGTTFSKKYTSGDAELWSRHFEQKLDDPEFKRTQSYQELKKLVVPLKANLNTRGGPLEELTQENVKNAQRKMVQIYGESSQSSLVEQMAQLQILALQSQAESLKDSQQANKVERRRFIISTIIAVVGVGSAIVGNVLQARG